MSFGFNSKFEDTSKNKKPIQDSVSNLFDISNNNKKYGTGAKESPNSKPSEKLEKNVKEIVQEIELDSLMFYNKAEKDKLLYYCTYLYHL